MWRNMSDLEKKDFFKNTSSKSLLMATRMQILEWIRKFEFGTRDASSIG